MKLHEHRRVPNRSIPVMTNLAQGAARVKSESSEKRFSVADDFQA